MHSKLVIIDISSMVYPRTVLKVGTDFWGGKYAMSRDEMMGLPIGGIKEVLTRTISKLKSYEAVVWAFDSKNTRKEMSDVYKANRTKSADMIIQTTILKDIGERLGIRCLSADGFEADEIIYKVVDQNLGRYATMDIYSGDKGDLAGCILNQDIRIIGTTASAITIDMQNYEYAVRSNKVIYYNSILPFNTFIGKPSNNLNALHIPSGMRPKDLYLDFIQFVKSSGLPAADYSKRTTMHYYLSDRVKNGTLTRDDVKAILERMELCYPRDIPDLDCTVPFYNMDNVNPQELLNVLRMFQLGEIARFLGIQEAITGAELSRADKNYLWNFKKIYEDGTFSVDNKAPLTTSVFDDLDDFGVGEIE